MQELIIADKKYQVIELAGRPKALLDRHVAEIYQVETKEINQAVNRNPEKFPTDFCFELTEEEKTEVVTSCDHLKYSPHLPKAFSWEGCNMLATILQSDVAIQRTIQIIRGFTAIEKGIADAKAGKGISFYQLNREWQAAIRMLETSGKSKLEAKIEGAKLVEEELGKNPYSAVGIEPPKVEDEQARLLSKKLERLLAWAKRRGLSDVKIREICRSNIAETAAEARSIAKEAQDLGFGKVELHGNRIDTLKLN